MNSINAQRNSLSMRLLLIIMACLLLLGFATTGAACGAQRSPSNEAYEAYEATEKARHALQAVKSSRTRMEIYCSNKHTTIVMEKASPDRGHMIFENAESITIGEDSYKREADGPWRKLPDRPVIPLEGMLFPMIINPRHLKSDEELKPIGPDTLGNIPVLVYQYTLRDNASNRVLRIDKYFIGAKDGLLHRIEMTKAASREPAAPPCKTIMTYYDFNAEIVIERPLVPPTLQTTETEAQLIDEKQPQAGQQAAEAWLKFMDERKTSEGWEAAAQCLKARFRKAWWEEQLRFLLSELGKERWTIKSRKLKKATFVKSLPSVHDQEGIVLEYEGALERYGPVSERVELVLEPDQVWRVAMYEASGGLISLTISLRSIHLDSCTGCGSGSGDGRGLGPGTGFNPGGSNPNAPATSVDQKPISLNSPSPRYTEEARKNKIQGTVRVRLLIGADGSVKQVRMVRGLPDGLEEEATRAAYQLRFRPAMKGGQPVAFWIPFDIEFNLR